MEDIEVKYNGKTFNDFKQQLIDFAKNYYPDTYNDFSPASPGVMFMEMASYVGDVLSFYQDIQYQETLLQYAKEPGNLYNLSYMMGYRPKVTTTSTVEMDVYQRVDAISQSNQNPNYNQALVISENSQLESTSNNRQRFITDNKVDFSFSSSFDPTEVSVYSTTGNTINEFLLKKRITAYSGEVKEVEFEIGSPEKFKTLYVEDSDIVGVLDITSDSGNGDSWHEVPYLAQDTIFDEVTNTSNDSNLAPYMLTLKKVPRRFVTRFDSEGNLKIQFGSGVSSKSDGIITPDPTNVGLGTNNGITKIDTAYDPANFMFTGAYGVAPSNTTLRVRYIVGGGIESNVPSNTITNIVDAPRNAQDLSKQNTVVFNNPKAAVGGKDSDTSEEIRQNSMMAFNEQLRAVTLSDYVVRSLSLPPRFGSIAKVHPAQDYVMDKEERGTILSRNPLSISLYVLAYDGDKKLIEASKTLKGNLKNYLSQYRMLTDGVNIRDGFIVNIGINYEIIMRPGYNGREVLLRCSRKLEDIFDISNLNMNQTINISYLYTELDKLKGVQTINNIEIVNKVGGDYSKYAYDVKGSIKNNILYPSYDPSIFEVKYPNRDIKGRITTL